MKTNSTLIVVLLAFNGAITHAQSESSPRVTGREKAAGVEVQLRGC